MRTPKFTMKRALGLSLASALAVTGTVVFAGSSQAATASYTVLPKTGPAYATSPASSSVETLTITGKAFEVGTTAKVGSVSFVLATATCAATYGSQSLIPTSISVVSPTKLVVTTGTGSTAGLPLSSTTAASTAYTACIYDTTSGTLNSANKLMGTAKYTVYPVSALTSVNGVSTAAAVSGSSLGGDALTIVGTNFTKASTIAIDGVTAKTTYVDATDLTAVTPAHAAGTGKSIVVTNEGGAVTGIMTFSFLDTIGVSPSFGNGTVGNVITVTGVGFNARTFASAAAINSSVIALAKAGTATATGTLTPATYTATSTVICTHVQVVSDTEANCQLPAVTLASAAGPYTAQIVDFNATVISAVTSVSRSASYTVSAF